MRHQVELMDTVLCKCLTSNLGVGGRWWRRARISVFSEDQWYFPEKTVIILTVKLNAEC